MNHGQPDNNLVKAAAVLGLCTGVGLVIASAVIVVGMRWAVAGAVGPQIEALDAQIAASAGRLEAAVADAGQSVGGQVDRSADELGGRVETAGGTVGQALAISLDNGVARLDKSIGDTGGRITGGVDAGAAAVAGTLARSFNEPLLIRAPQPLPLTGDDRGEPITVDANLLGN